MMRNKDLISGCILIVFVIFAFFQTYYFGEVSDWSCAKSVRFSPTPATWPRIVLYVLFFLSILLLSLGIHHRKTSYIEELDKEEYEEEQDERKNIRNAIIFNIVFFGYLFLMEFIGFALDTIILGFVFVLFMGRGELKLWKGCIISFIVSILIVLSFSRLLYLPLPKGMWFFRVFSDFVMY